MLSGPRAEPPGNQRVRMRPGSGIRSFHPEVVPTKKRIPVVGHENGPPDRATGTGSV